MTEDLPPARVAYEAQEIAELAAAGPDGRDVPVAGMTIRSRSGPARARAR